MWPPAPGTRRAEGCRVARSGLAGSACGSFRLRASREPPRPSGARSNQHDSFARAKGQCPFRRARESPRHHAAKCLHHLRAVQYFAGAFGRRILGGRECVRLSEVVRRSWLLIPATRADLIDAAWQFNADVVVLDLEDTVHDRRKPVARAAIEAAISKVRRGGAEVFVRCDIELLYADLAASVWHGIQGIMLPKVESKEQVAEAEALLAEFEAERGVRKSQLAGVVDESDNPRGIDDAIELHLGFETARGNHDAVDLIAASRRVRSVSLGRADLVMDLRPEPSGDLHFMTYLMQRLVIVAGASGVTPIGAWWRGNSRGLRASATDTRTAAELGVAAGFKGAICVEPDQVESLNAGFTPGPAAVNEAREAQKRRRDPSATAGATALLAWAAACAARDDFKREAFARAKEMA